MSGKVWVLGGYQSDFARNLSREGRGVDALTDEVVRGALTTARTAAEDVKVIHVGNAFGQLFTGQGHLGAMPATVVPELWGKPASRHEAACASGSVAVLAAMADLRSGSYDCALVVGLEIEKTVAGDEAARLLGAAAWVGHEADGVTYVWPHQFSGVADEYDARYGLHEAHLHRIAEVNLANAKRNPHARPAAGRCRSPSTTTRSTPWSRDGCAGSTAARSPTGARRWSSSTTTSSATTRGPPARPGRGLGPPDGRSRPLGQARALGR